MGTAVAVNVLEALDLSELILMARTGVDELVHTKPDPDSTVDELGEFLPIVAYADASRAITLPLWERLKAEFQLLLCSADSKYDGLRQQFASLGSRSQMTIVSSIAAAMATYVGIAAGILVPFCALCLVAFLKLGKEAFCAAQKWDMKIE
jgi:hypothetical protein